MQKIHRMLIAAQDAETTHEKRRPPEAEVAGDRYHLFKVSVEKLDITAHIAHLSTAEKDYVPNRDRRGLKARSVTTEVTPHHLRV